MLILKSFIRKKTTKIYLVVYTLILSSLFLLIFINYTLNLKENNLYDGSFIEIINEDIKKTNNIKEIKEVKNAIRISYSENDEYHFVYDSSLKLTGNKIVISKEFNDEVKISDEITIESNGNSYSFIIAGLNKEGLGVEKIYVSKEMYDKMKNNGEEESYLIILNRWKRQYDDTIYKLNKIYDTSNIRPHVIAPNSNYSIFITISNVFLWVLTILFGIVLIITCFNIIQDEKKKNIIYYRIGYRKITLIVYNLCKICILIIFSILMSLVIFCILYLIYRIIFKI